MNHLRLLSYIYLKARNQLGSSWVNNTAIHIEQNQHGLHNSVISIKVIVCNLTYYIHTATRSTKRENRNFEAQGKDTQAIALCLFQCAHLNPFWERIYNKRLRHRTEQLAVVEKHVTARG